MAPMQCTQESMHVNGDSTTVLPLLDQGSTTWSKATEHCWVYWVRFVGDITRLYNKVQGYGALGVCVVI
jgi:hypothetical protein